MDMKLGLLLCGEEHGLRVFESGVLRKIFGLQREGKYLSTCHFGHH
jgi:hypothetical protein